MKIRWSQALVILVALVFAHTPASDAGVVTYNSAAAWQAAASPTTPATAGNVPAPGVTIASGAVGGFTPPINGNKVDDFADNGVSTTWSFASPIFGFGGLWDLAGPGGPGTGLVITLMYSGGGSFTLPGELSKFWGGQFFGFTSTQAVASFIISEGTQGCCQETYSITDPVYSAAAPVPEPATLFLLGAGLFGTGAAARRRRKP